MQDTEIKFKILITYFAAAINIDPIINAIAAAHTTGLRPNLSPVKPATADPTIAPEIIYYFFNLKIFWYNSRTY